MKNNQTTATTAAAAIAAQPTQVATSAQSTQLVSQVLLECMSELRSIHLKIADYYVSNRERQDSIKPYYVSIDCDIESIASEISGMMSLEMLASTFYAKTAQESEVHHA